MSVKLSTLRADVERAAQNVTYGYRIIYVLVGIGLFWAGLAGKIPFWTSTIAALLGAIALDVFEYVATIISLMLTYRKFVKAGKRDDDAVVLPAQMNTLYWVCWTLKVLFTITLIVTLGYNLFVTFWIK